MAPSPDSRRPGRIGTGAAALLLATVLGLPAQEPPGGPPPGDPVADLQARLDRGEVTLAFDESRGWLPSLLTALDIPVESQVLVFSRTSLQTDLISPWTPRALYFNDDVYLGWVPDSPMIEVASVDPRGGAAFFAVSQDPAASPSFRRQSTTCLMCHESRAVTGGVPGFIVRSVLADRLGYPIASIHEGSTTDRTPFDRRFGGYYVTGIHGALGHRGNVHAPVRSVDVTDPDRYLEDFQGSEPADDTPLGERVDLTPYASAHSDVVALLVLAHQAHVHNLIAAARGAGEAAAAESTLSREVSAAGRQRIDGAVEQLLRAMLFSGEATWPGPARGSTAFAETFEGRGPFDARGRTLRAFDLERRLFRYPLSFLVYSDAFAALPEAVRARFRDRLDDVLSGRDGDSRWSHLDPEDRAAIAEILRATHPDFTGFLPTGGPPAPGPGSTGR